MTRVVWPLKEYERAQERKASHRKQFTPRLDGGDQQRGKNPESSEIYQQNSVDARKKGEIKKSAKSDTKELLRCMGAYFELDPKRVNFWIRQMELSGKL